MKGIYHPSLGDRVRESEREKKERPKKEKTKKKDCPDFTRCDAEWSGKNAHSFRSRLSVGGGERPRKGECGLVSR